MGSIEVARKVFFSENVERPPIFDLIRNDVAIEHYSGVRFSPDNGEELVYKALSEALDATRPQIIFPQQERVEQFPDGTKIEYQRWTTWYRHPAASSLENYIQWVTSEIDALEAGSGHTASDNLMQEYRKHRRHLGDIALLMNPGTKTGLMTLITTGGLENFSYLMQDRPDLIRKFIDSSTASSLSWIESADFTHCFPVVFIGEDIAFGGGPMVSNEFLHQTFYGHLEKIVAAYHDRGIKVLFHSDGNLMPILDDLVATGIDGLNPIDIAAGMDIAEIRSRHPRLVMVGGIDCAHLLPFASPGQVASRTRETIEIAGPAYFVGSSSEQDNQIPLDNIKAMIDTAREYRY